MNYNNTPGLSNVTSDQGSYDFLYRDVLFNYKTVVSDNLTSYQLQIPEILRIYKAEVISATVKFNSSIPTNVQNSSLIVSLSQLNGPTINGQLTFAQIPDNCTPLNIGTNTITLYQNAPPFTTGQWYNPPISQINSLTLSFNDLSGNVIPITNATSGTINSFYLTVRVYYFQKRAVYSEFSTPVLKFYS